MKWIIRNPERPNRKARRAKDRQRGKGFTKPGSRS